MRTLLVVLVVLIVLAVIPVIRILEWQPEIFQCPVCEIAPSPYQINLDRFRDFHFPPVEELVEEKPLRIPTEEVVEVDYHNFEHEDVDYQIGNAVQVAAPEDDKYTLFYREKMIEGIQAVRNKTGVLIVLQVQKVGGSSLRFAIEEIYPGLAKKTSDELTKGFNPDFGYWLPHSLAESRSLQKYKCFYGHYAFGVHNAIYPKPFHYITLFRHPIDRVISLYYYVEERYFTPELGGSLEGFMSPSNSFQYHNKDNGFVRALCGYDAWITPMGELNLSHLECAKRNLKRYFTVLILDRYDLSVEMIRRLFNWPQLKEQKKNPTRPYPKSISNALAKQMKQQLALDIELYNYAIILWWEQALEIIPDLLVDLTIEDLDFDYIGKIMD